MRVRWQSIICLAHSIMNRPKSVTLLAVGVLTLAGYYFIRIISATAQWEFLTDLYPDTLIPIYLALTGIFWGLLGLVLGWGLLRGRRWAPRTLRISAIAFAIYWWVDNLLLAADPAVERSVPFRLAGTIALLGLVFLVLARPAVKSYFGELND